VKGVIITSCSGDLKLRQITIEAGKEVWVFKNVTDRQGNRQRLEETKRNDVLVFLFFLKKKKFRFLSRGNNCFSCDQWIRSCCSCEVGVGSSFGEKKQQRMGQEKEVTKEEWIGYLKNGV
jgi:hypothetical protein